MNIIKSDGDIKLTVVCCLHGDEVFGQKVFEAYRARITALSGVQFILANEEALERQVRFVESDLNRSFPGNLRGNLEQRLAAELMATVGDSEYVLDIHTTTSDIKMTPIVSKLSERVRMMLNLCQSQEIVLMSKQIANHSLIGNVAAGVSLEFEEGYATTDGAFEEVAQIIDGILGVQVHPAVPRKIYHVDRTIGLEISLPEEANNFQYMPKLGFYPFLLGERAYVDFLGFAATRVKELRI